MATTKKLAMKPDQEVKLTHGRISQSLCTIINRLQNGQRVPKEQVMNTPEIKLAEQILAQAPMDTSLLNQDIRRPLHNGIRTKLMAMGSYNGIVRDEDGVKHEAYDGPVEYGKQAHFVIGLPASGKSSALVNVISQEFGAKIFDNDMPKEMIPEFWNGWGSGSVHNEAKMLTDEAMNAALSMGANVVIPKIGEPPESVAYLMEQCKDAGYEVHVHFMDIDARKALGRNLARFVYTGRYVDPTWLYKFMDNGDYKGSQLMRNSFETLKTMQYNGQPLCDGYSEWTNEVEYGEQPILADYGGTCSGRFLDVARTDMSKKQIIVEEDKFVEDISVAKIGTIVEQDNVDLLKQGRNAKDTALKIAVEQKHIAEEKLAELERIYEEREALHTETEAIDEDKVEDKGIKNTRIHSENNGRIRKEESSRIRGTGKRGTPKGVDFDDTDDFGDDYNI